MYLNSKFEKTLELYSNPSYSEKNEAQGKVYSLCTDTAISCRVTGVSELFALYTYPA